VNILLVRPAPPPETIGLQHVMVVEPLELEVLAATLPDRHEVRIVDMILESDPLEDFIRDFDPDILAVTGYITHMGVIRDYCRRAKVVKPGLVTVAGGVHIEKNAADADSPWIDYRVIRNAVKVFPELVAFIEGDSSECPSCVLSPLERPGELPALDFTFPHPRRDLTRRYRDRYFYVFHNKVAALKTSFGCPAKCSFCYCREITDGRYCERPMSDVLDELADIDQSEIFIIDDNFLASRRRLTDFLDGLDDRGITKHYLVFGRADFIIKYPALMERFRKRGLRTVIVGLESFDDDELNDMNKSVSAADNELALGILRELGIGCYASIILNPDWDQNDFARLRRKVRELGILFANYQPLTPLPGTAMTVAAEDLVVDRQKYSHWDLAHLVVKPGRLSASEYYGEIIKLYTASVVHPLTVLRHLKYPLKDVLRISTGAFKVWRQYRAKMKEATSHG
jgi:radical SAM superfamily enzyme YgiQ (UPF0313 family)